MPTVTCWFIHMRRSFSSQRANCDLLVYPHEKVKQHSECQQLWPAGLSPWECHPAVRVPTVTCWFISMRRSSSSQNANFDLLVCPFPQKVIQQSECLLWPSGLSPWESHPAVRMPTVTLWFAHVCYMERGQVFQSKLTWNNWPIQNTQQHMASPVLCAYPLLLLLKG